ncbi:pyridoxal phosphate-dependent aminotransferase [Candidatus Bathyarchaeota archaeon]|nr:MAG: pyridoxal phosphate-dependent aminotransferase [Candidatus Bathyarchaeota archaeon]
MKNLASRGEQIKRPLHREIRDYAAKLGFKDMIYLNVGEPDFPTPEPIVEAGIAALKEGFTHYTEERGIKPLREALASRLAEEKGLNFNPETELLITSGSSEALLASILAILDSGEEALIFSPHYPPYLSAVLVALGKPVLVPVERGTFTPNPEITAEKITDKTKLMIVNSPCNPTGAVYPREVLRALAELAVDHDLYVVSDEVYDRFLFDGETHVSIASFPGMAERTVVIGSFSKTYAMTGWRVGYVAGPEKVITRILRIKGAGNVCASSIAQKAALTALEKAEPYVSKMLKEYDRRRMAIYEALNRIKGFKTPKPKGAFYVFPDISELEEDSLKFAKFLVERAHVVTSPGVGFGQAGEGCLRISYSASLEDLKEAAERIKLAVEDRWGV